MIPDLLWASAPWSLRALSAIHRKLVRLSLPSWCYWPLVALCTWLVKELETGYAGSAVRLALACDVSKVTTMHQNK